MDQVIRCWASDAIEVYSLIGRNVIAQLQICIVKRCVLRWIVQSAAKKIAEITLACGSKPRTSSACAQWPFSIHFRVRQSSRNAIDWRGPTAVASFECECRPHVIAVLLWI